MSTSVSPRPLPLLPFAAADAVLLLTALLIAWRTPDELAGGALLAVVVCTVVGAIIAVLPFVLNDARERDAALAERQRELVELVTTSTASASRWGTQWAAAATGLEDAAALASRSIAAADRLPVVFQEQVDGLSQKFDQAGREAQLRTEVAANQESALAARAEQIGTAASGLQQTLTEFEQVQSGLSEQRTAIASLLAEFPAAAAQAQAARKEMGDRLESAPALIEQRISDIVSRAETRLSELLAEFPAAAAQAQAAHKELDDRLISGPAQVEQRIADIVNGAETRLSALLAEFPVAAAQAQSARQEFEHRLESAPARLEERVNVLTAQAETRLSELSETLAGRLTEVEALIGSLRDRLQSAIDAPLPQPVVVTPVEPVTPQAAHVEPESPAVAEVIPAAAEVAADMAVEVDNAPEPLAEVAPVIDVAKVAPVIEPAAPAAVAKEKEPIRSETIMDPFIIPDNGYDALAAAMDGR